MLLALPLSTYELHPEWSAHIPHLIIKRIAILDRGSHEGDDLELYSGQVQHASVEKLTAFPNEQEVDTLEDLEDPTHGRALGWLAHLVGDGLILRFQGGPQMMLGQGIDQEAEAHDHQQGHDPFRFLEEEAVGKEQRVLEEAKAALHRDALGFVHREHGRRR
jgi:hypothetical protein